MNIEIFIGLANALGRPDLLGPLALGRVATDLFAFALGLKCPSSLFKKLEKSGPGEYPPLHESSDSRRKWFLLDEIETWHISSLLPAGEKKQRRLADVSKDRTQLRQKRLGRPCVAERREAIRRGISVTTLRSLGASAHGGEE